MAFVHGGDKFEEREMCTRFLEAWAGNWQHRHLWYILSAKAGLKASANPKAEKYRFCFLMGGMTKGMNTGRDEGLHPFLQSTTAINKVMFCTATFKQVILEGLFYLYPQLEEMLPRVLPYMY